VEKKTIEAAQAFSEERFTKRILFQQGGSVAFVLNFMPGQELPTHKHLNTAVYLLVLQGDGTIIVDGVKTEVSEGDAICCDGEEQFAFANTGNARTSLYVVLNRLPDERYAQDI